MYKRQVLSTSANLMVSGNLQSVMSDGVIRFDQLSDKEDKVSEGDKMCIRDSFRTMWGRA